MGKLPLGILRSFAGAFQTGLLAFLGAGIAGQEAVLLQNRAKGLVSLNQGAGDAVTDCSGLAADTTANYLDRNIVLAQTIDQAQSLLNDNLVELAATEVIRGGLAVDGESTGSG